MKISLGGAELCTVEGMLRELLLARRNSVARAKTTCSAILPMVWLRLDDGGSKGRRWCKSVEFSCGAGSVASEQIPRFCFESLPVCLNPSLSSFPWFKAHRI